MPPTASNAPQAVTGTGVTFRVFLSSPSDVDVERAAADGVISHLSNRLRGQGISLTSIMWERDARQRATRLGQEPQDLIDEDTPPDYEVYVGIMSARYGTPTASGATGTVREFEQALDRYRQTGSPHVLFYFGKPSTKQLVDDALEQYLEVQKFKRNYPGIYRVYEGSEDLRLKLALDLIDVILRPNQRPAPFAALRAQPWHDKLLRHIDLNLTSGSEDAYLLSSTLRTRHTLEQKFERLVDASRTLAEEERCVFATAAYLRSAGCDLVPDALARGMVSVGFECDWLEAVNVALNAASATDPREFRKPLQHAGIDCGRIACLLRVVELLAFDRDAICNTDGLATAPPPSASVEDWLCYSTHQIEIVGPGIVRYHLIVPKNGKDTALVLQRCTAARFDWLWQLARPSLTRAHVPLVRSVTQVTQMSGVAPMPPGLNATLRAISDTALASLEKISHYGGRTQPIKVEHLLPLPEGAIAHAQEIAVEPAQDHRLTISDGQGTGPSVVQDTRTNDKLVIDPEGLKPGVEYRWRLEQLHGDFDVRVASGGFSTLSSATRIWLETAGRYGKPIFRAALASLDLRNDLLIDAWPELENPQAQSGQRASMSDLLAVYRLLRDAYEWYRASDPASPRVELYRDSINFAYHTLLQQWGT